jgi:DMSO reductase anchor subunit
MAGEWPLVAFTIIGQSAAGFFLFAGALLYFSSPAGGAGLTAALAVLGSLVAAAALSLFHLRRPARAFRVLSNVGTSPLSREILFGLAFTAFVGLLAVCEWRGVGSRGLLQGLFVLGGLAGVFFVLSMSRVYMLPAEPGWDRSHTPLSFFATALMLGASGAAVFIGSFAAPPDALRPLVAAAFVSAAGGLACVVVLTPGRGVLGGGLAPSLRPPRGVPSALFAARVAALLAGMALLAAAWGGLGRRGAPGFLLPAALAVLAAGETSGRFLFYALAGATRTKQIS